MALWLAWSGLSLACSDGSERETSHDDSTSSTTSGSGGSGGTGGSAITWGIEERWRVDLDTAGVTYGSIERLSPAPDGSVYVLFSMPTAIDVWQLDRLTPEGEPASGAWPIEGSFTAPSWNGGYGFPRVAPLSDGSAVVTWAGTSGWEIARYSTEGALLWQKTYATGPGAFPTGVLVDANDRIVVYGAPQSMASDENGPGALVRYDASGARDASFAPLLSLSTTPALAYCNAAAIDRTSNELLVLGKSVPTDGSTGTFPAWDAVRRVADDGSLLTSGAHDDLFGHQQTFQLTDANNFIVTGDGTLVAERTQESNMLHPLARRAWARPGAAIVKETWIAGTVRVAHVAEANVVLEARAVTQFDPIELELQDESASALATMTIDGPERVYLLDAAGRSGNDVWLAWYEDSVAEGWHRTIARVSITQTPNEAP